jgi:hypothetical protein
MDTLEHPKPWDGLIHDVAVTSMSGMVFNPIISQLLPKEEAEAKKAQDEIVSVVSDAMRSIIGMFYPELAQILIASRGNGVSPDEWRVECERAALHAGALLRLARIQGMTSAATLEMILTAPRTNKGLDDLPETALFVRVALDAQRYIRDDRDREVFQRAIDYFTKHLAQLAPERRRMLEASIAGTFMGWLMS